MRVRVNGWQNERTVRISKKGLVSFEVAFNGGITCLQRIDELRERLDAKMLRGKMWLHSNGTAWLKVRMDADQLRQPLKYLSLLVGAHISEVKK